MALWVLIDSMFNIEKYLSNKQAFVNKALNKYLPDEKVLPKLIHRAMRYSVFAGGKRFRPILVLTSGEMLGARSSQLLPVACAIEFIHTYSLIHDDLPAMDNDDLRRGRATCHKVFGEALAILAGDALSTFAFEVMADEITEKKLAARLMGEIAGGAGSKGMVGGQVLDICNTKEKSQHELEQMHLMKTTALITTAVRLGALVAGANSSVLNRLSRYGRNLGLAFQVADDILDVRGTRSTLGKTPGKDKRLNRLTYPALYGLKKAQAKALALAQQAKRALRSFGKKAEVLSALADYVINRGY